MPWQNHSKMSLKLEFAKPADKADANMSALCRWLNISRPNGYKWLVRYQEDGPDGEERSRCPSPSPNKTPARVVETVYEVRNKHSVSGGRTIRGRLWKNDEEADLFSTLRHVEVEKRVDTDDFNGCRLLWEVYHHHGTRCETPASATRAFAATPRRESGHAGLRRQGFRDVAKPHAHPYLSGHSFQVQPPD